MLTLQHLSYVHPDKDVLFEDINITIGKHQKAALIGNNGSGKSTLLKIIAGELSPSAGTIHYTSQPCYVPQHFGQYNHLTVAQALGVADKLAALRHILDGDVTETYMDILGDDWDIEERCNQALQHWDIDPADLSTAMAGFSGGQKTRIFLAGIQIHKPEIVLLDEPGNHLDSAGMSLLYNMVSTYPGAMLIVSHNRQLLNMLPLTYELTHKGITVYGGNYDFYLAQKNIEQEALSEDVKSKEKALRKAKDTEREAIERQQKLNARGKGKQEKAGMPTIMMNTMRNNAEQSTARIKGVHTQKIDGITTELDELRKELPGLDKMKLGFDHSALHKGKTLFQAQGINYSHPGKGPLWHQPLELHINSGERIVLSGPNGSGKTTLIRLILGQLEPSAGKLHRAITHPIYIDQEYSLVNNNLTVYEQVQQYNTRLLEEHELKIRLTWFLFTKEHWDKPCAALSGGQKMRLALCCLTVGNQAPDVIVLDEPTNNLDIRNIDILTEAIRSYEGTLIIVSHDNHFLDDIGITRNIEL